MLERMSLIPVKDIQKLFYKKNYYSTLKEQVNKTELIQYSILENNIFGINDRFIDDNGAIDDDNGDSLCSSFFQNYLLQHDLTIYIRDILILILIDCEQKQFFEMANNLHFILTETDKPITIYENGFAELLKEAQDDLPF